MMNTRKRIRLKHYDYSLKGAYFITICIKGRVSQLSVIRASEDGNACPFIHELTDLGRIVDEAILSIPEHYPNVGIDDYVIMPDHVHMIVCMENVTERPSAASESINAISEHDENEITKTDISRIVQQMKGYVTKRYGEAIWQRSYFDHVIRNESDHTEICRYIEENPIKWYMEIQRTRYVDTDKRK